MYIYNFIYPANVFNSFKTDVVPPFPVVVHHPLFSFQNSKLKNRIPVQDFFFSKRILQWERHCSSSCWAKQWIMIQDYVYCTKMSGCLCSWYKTTKKKGFLKRKRGETNFLNLQKWIWNIFSPEKKKFLKKICKWMEFFRWRGCKEDLWIRMMSTAWKWVGTVHVLETKQLKRSVSWT